MHPFFGGLCHSRIARGAGFTLFALAWISPAFCGGIHDAAAHGDVKSVEALLSKDPNLVFSKDEFGGTPLHKAAGMGRKEVAELLLAKRADVNAKDNQGDTPLHDAAMVGVLSAAADVGESFGESLLKETVPGAARNSSKDNRGRAHAIDDWSERQKDVVKLLLASHADVGVTNDRGETPLFMAAALGCKDMVALLLRSKADINARSNKGDTPLHAAATQPSKDVAELLLAYNADVNAKDNEGRTPLQFALSSGREDVAEFLRRHGGHE